MANVTAATLPPDISPELLKRWLSDSRSHETLLGNIVSRFAQRYHSSLEELESRLARGEGSEHPDWEDSIEWRNAVEELQRTRLMRSLLEWLLHSNAHSTAF